MKKLDRYLLRQFLLILTIALIAFNSIFIIVDLIENLDRFIDNAVSGKIVVAYYLYSIPWFINIGFPMATLIATVFSIGLMAKRNEYTVLKAAGVSLYRIAIPLVLLGILLSGLSFELENRLVSWGNEHRYDIERRYLKRNSRRSVPRMRSILTNIFLQKQGSQHISITTYKTRKQIAENVTIVSLDSERIQQRIDAKEMVWIDSLEAWASKDYSIRRFDAQGKEIGAHIAHRDTLFHLSFRPDDISKRFKSPDELNYFELESRIRLLKENGVDVTRWEVARQFKISFAFTNLIVILFGLPLVVLRPKGGLSFGAGMSVFVIFGYYAFIKFGQSLGYQRLLSPVVSAWLGNVVFTAGSVLLTKLVRK
ncbi:MAG: YjgP/YjgQ family permease [Candidatus Neomarinimicrobiota bacterium]|nr:MAG: YjgP/YjgQ family permease [Candidatus Neomarinimicrobiota bacterium]